MNRVKNRASEFKTQHEEIDNNVLQKIEIELTDSDVFTALEQLWVEDYETEEKKSLAIWNKKEKGLRKVYDKEIRDKIDLHQPCNNVHRQMKVDKTKELDHLTTEIVPQHSPNTVVLKETISKIKETIKIK